MIVLQTIGTPPAGCPAWPYTCDIMDFVWIALILAAWVFGIGIVQYYRIKIRGYEHRRRSPE